MKINSDINKFYEIYPNEKSSVNYANLWRYTFVNPISIFIAYLLSFFKTKPSLVTLISFIIGIFGLYHLFISNFLYGSILLNLSYLLDCVDGHLARYYNATSKRGRFFDDFSGIIIWAFAWPCLGFGLFFNPDIEFQTFFQDFFGVRLNSIFFVLFGLVAGFCSELRTLMSFKYSQINNNISSESKTAKNKYKSKGLFYLLFKNIISVGGFVAPILIISSLLDMHGFLIFIYFTIYLFVFIFYSFRYYFRL
tara:strand:+ start:12361 stop:13113 length:753 start_codon:yes stop_codon:yes gene_type:complete